MSSILLFLGFTCSTLILFWGQSGNRTRKCNYNFFSATSMAFLLMGIVSLVAVRLSLFSLPFVVAIMLPSSGLLALLQRFAGNLERKRISQDKSSSFTIVLFGALLCIIFYALFPTYYLQGGRDHGVYLLFSHYINKTGGLNLDLPWLQEAYETYGNSIHLDYDGIYSALQRGLSDDPTKLIPQFMHLFPAYGAIGAALAGIEGIVRTNAVIVFFALWSFFMVAREFMKTWAAVLATLLLLINPALLWTGRATFTEPLHIFIFFFGLHLLHNAVKFKSPYQGAIAGLVLGLAVLNRLSGGLNIITVAGGILYVVLVRPECRRAAWAISAGYFLAATIGFLDGYIHSFPYFTDLWAEGGLRIIVFSNYCVIAMCMLLLCLRLSDQIRLRALYILKKMILPILLVLIGWLFIRYQLGGIEQNNFFIRAARELSWYVPGEVMILSLLSLLFAKNNNDWCYLFLICICLCTTLFIYTWKPSIHPDHFWASRRWVAFCIPLIMLGFGKTMEEVYTLFTKSGFSTVSAAFVIGIPVSLYSYQAFMLASPFLLTSMLHSYPEGYARVSKNIKSLNNDGVYLTRDRQSASYLTYMYDIPTVMLTELGMKRISQGKLAHQPALGFGHDLSDGTDRYSLCGRYTERVIARKPVRLIQECNDLTPGFTIDPKSCQNIILRSVSDYINTGIGTKDLKAETLTSNGAEGFLQFGPYIATGVGKYRVLWRGKVLQAKDASLGAVDVVTNKGQKIVKSNELSFNKNSAIDSLVLASLDFELKQPVSDLEYRFYVKKGAIVSLSSIELKCIQSNQK